MARILRAQVLGAGLVVCLTLAGPWCHADILEGRVVGVSDGDTITLLDAEQRTHKIRLSGIDAPEKDQAFGQRSKQHLSDAVFGKDIQVDHHKKDRYGRLLGKLIKDGEDLNLKQIQAGLAWCRIPDDCIDPRRYPLLAAREAMRQLVDDLLGRSIRVPGAFS